MTPGITQLTDLRGQLRRADKIMTTEEVGAFLEGAFCGRTATNGADGYPSYSPGITGRCICTTGRHPGHFAANVRHCERVSFEVDEPGEVFPYGNIECDTSVSYQSVVMFGRFAFSIAKVRQMPSLSDS